LLTAGSTRATATAGTACATGDVDDAHRHVIRAIGITRKTTAIISEAVTGRASQRSTVALFTPIDLAIAALLILPLYIENKTTLFVSIESIDHHRDGLARFQPEVYVRLSTRVNVVIAVTHSTSTITF